MSTGSVTGLSITTILMILSIIINIILILFIVVTYKKSKVYQLMHYHSHVNSVVKFPSSSGRVQVYELVIKLD